MRLIKEGESGIRRETYFVNFRSERSQAFEGTSSGCDAEDGCLSGWEVMACATCYQVECKALKKQDVMTTVEVLMNLDQEDSGDKLKRLVR
jgi:hypothetical protein